MIKFYVAILERDADGFGVFFPDVPGCVSAGATEQEAAANAEDALYGHLTLALEHNEALPEPTPIDRIVLDDDISEVARLLVRFEPPGKAVRVNITLPEDLLVKVDRFATANGYTRSGLLAQAVRKVIVQAPSDI
jgi:predicted RNase H-like HicB family nuclease